MLKDYMKNAGLTFKGQLEQRKITRGIVLHHAAVVSATPQAIHNAHLNRGWIGAGYHIYIRKDGSVWELRPLWSVGAHAGAGNNSDTIGVCVEGNYQSIDKEMPKAQFNSLVQVIKDLKKEYNIQWIKGHKEMPGAQTACPGDYFPMKKLLNIINKTEVEELRRGDKGQEVKLLQETLLKLGYTLPKYGADGAFGGETETALNAFKKDVGLPQDGVVDIKTIFALNKALVEKIEKETAQKIKEAEAKASQGDGLYRVQVGAFQKRENAEALLNKLKKAGFDGFIKY